MQPSALLLLTSLNNANLHHPRTGCPLPPESYGELVADMPHRVVGDTQILNQYLRKQGPALSREVAPDELAQELRVSLIASEDGTVFRDYPGFADWPHAEGCLRLNPLFHPVSSDHPTVFRRQFPSEWYEIDNAALKEYLPLEIQISPDVLREVNAGQRTPRVESLIDRFAVLGMPERFLPPTPI
jgi:hypothetical protein